VSARGHREDLCHTGERVIDSDLCLTVEKTNIKGYYNQYSKLYVYVG